MRAFLLGVLLSGVVTGAITGAVVGHTPAETAQLEEARLTREDLAFCTRARDACNIGLDICERSLGVCHAEGGCR